MSPTPPSPSWPVPSSIALGSWNDEDGEFVARLVVPVTFEQEGINYTVNAELQSSTVDTAMALAFPDELAVNYASDDSNFEGAFNGDSYVAWKALTAMSNISGNLQVHLMEGLIALQYSFV